MGDGLARLRRLQPAVAQDGDSIGYLEHLVEAVADVQERHVGASQLPDELKQMADLTFGKG